jgi:hypothetical protein
MHDKIAAIKVGWSEDYSGGSVRAAHAYVVENAEGHEKFNFLRAPDGRYYGYTPPIGAAWSAPKPRDRKGWTVFALSKKPFETGLFLIGWYEDAEFIGRYKPRPEYDDLKLKFRLDNKGEKYLYTFFSEKATLIPAQRRKCRLSGANMKRAPIYYLRGNGRNDAWREQVIADLLEAQSEVRRTLAS